MQAIGGGGQVAMSSVGSLVFLPEQAPDLVLLDRAGRSEVVGQGRRFHSPRISPDGGRVAYDFIQQGMRDVWTFDLRQRTLTRLSFENDGHDPVWSPDGRWVYYVHGAGMWRRRADGGGGADSVFTGAGQALEVERDGSVITATTISGSLVGGFDVGRWSPDAPRDVTPLLSSPYSEQAATLSPDRRWLAYASDETGRSEVYVRSFPEGGAKVLVSRGGGSEPQWSPDGRTLYYRGQSDGRTVMIAAAVVPGAEFTIAARAPLFDVAEYEPAEPHRNWDLTPDGRRFAMVHQGTLTQMYVILNWPEEVRRQSASRSATP
jgi:serine/threonine-protein kinase